MHARMSRERSVKIARERSVGSLEHRFDIASGKHRCDIAGTSKPRRSAIGRWTDLNRDWRGCETGACKRSACCFAPLHEMADMIEKDLVGARELPVCVRAHYLTSLMAVLPCQPTLPRTRRIDREQPAHMR